MSYLRKQETVYSQFGQRISITFFSGIELRLEHMNILFEFAEIQHLSSASVLSPLSEAIHPGYMRVARTLWL